MYRDKVRTGENSGYVESVAKLKHGKFTVKRILYLKDNQIRETVIFKEFSNTRLWNKQIHQSTYIYPYKLRIALYDIIGVNEDLLNKSLSSSKPVELPFREI